MKRLVQEKDAYISLFTVMIDESYKAQYCFSEHRVYINSITGIPSVEIWSFTDIAIRPGSVATSDKFDISYERLLEYAKYHSEETYKKFTGINADNWIDYVIDMI